MRVLTWIDDSDRLTAREQPNGKWTVEFSFVTGKRVYHTRTDVTTDTVDGMQEAARKNKLLAARAAEHEHLIEAAKDKLEAAKEEVKVRCKFDAAAAKFEDLVSGIDNEQDREIIVHRIVEAWRGIYTQPLPTLEVVETVEDDPVPPPEELAFRDELAAESAADAKQLGIEPHPVGSVTDGQWTVGMGHEVL